MNNQERAARITAWTWAAQILGVEAGPDRILGLVEVTASVRADNLKPALEAVIKSEPHGFMPSRGAVIEAAKRLAERVAMSRPRIERGPMSPEDRRRWEAEHNPEGWDDETWRAFNVRMGTDPFFAARARRANEERHAWAAEECARQLGRRRAAAGFAHDLRLDLNRQAFGHIPRPNPWEDDWQMPRNPDPISGLVSSRALPRDRRIRSSAPLRSNPIDHDDSKGIEAARAANANRPKEDQPRRWS